jgi:hypothetical protein
MFADGPFATYCNAAQIRSLTGHSRSRGRLSGEQMVNQNIGRGLLLAAVALVFSFQAPLAILTSRERALRVERFAPSRA